MERGSTKITNGTVLYSTIRDDACDFLTFQGSGNAGLVTRQQEMKMAEQMGNGRGKGKGKEDTGYVTTKSTANRPGYLGKRG